MLNGVLLPNGKAFVVELVVDAKSNGVMTDGVFGRFRDDIDCALSLPVVRRSEADICLVL
eukprot:COSAG02_NODE_27058_length_618_cov_0.678227_1_plen_59_part_10